MTGRHTIGIPLHQLDFVWLDSESLGNSLSENRVMTLTVRLVTDENRGAAVW